MLIEDKLSEMIPENGVIDFFTEWCQPCKTMEPIVEKLKNEGYNIVQINAEDYDDIAEYFQVKGVPTFVKIENGKEDRRTTGAIPEDKFRRFAQ